MQKCPNCGFLSDSDYCGVCNAPIISGPVQPLPPPVAQPQSPSFQTTEPLERPSEKKAPIGAIITVAVVIIIMLATIFTVLFIIDSGPEYMTAAEWNVEYSVYEEGLLNLEPNFPSYDGGDTVTIKGTITDNSIGIFGF